ncbi:FRG domain-containing protein [Paraburkholderia sp. BL6665CI2N2]|nr:FRG domain-containing protein [Paraburkholderia sp. BL6665CI2N2]
MLNTITVANVSELIAAISLLNAEVSRSHLWYRGHRSATWALKPTAFRDEHERQERNYVHRFRCRAGTRYSRSPDYDNRALWLSLMQHYGLPTRLLDWSRSPMVAAYFALESYLYDSKLKPETAAIWVLQAHTLNNLECNDEITPAIESQMVAPFLDPAFDTTPENHKVLAVMASEHDLRMFVQQGCFTVHSDHTALDLRSNSQDYLTKLVIPTDAVESFSREIEVCGFRKGDIYPDLQHLADELRAKKGI